MAARQPSSPKAKTPAKKAPVRGRSAAGAGSKGKKPAKRPRGQPAKFTEPETMATQIEAYFRSLKAKGSRAGEPPTMAGLALALGFSDRQSLRDYSERTEDFSCVVKNARLQIEEFHERRLCGQYPTGSIFWLKNHSGYADKTELTGANGGPFEVVNMTPEQRAARLAEIMAKA